MVLSSDAISRYGSGMSLCVLFPVEKNGAKKSPQEGRAFKERPLTGEAGFSGKLPLLPTMDDPCPV